MLSTRTLSKGLRVPLWLMIVLIFTSLVVPSVLAQPQDASSRHEAPSNVELAYGLEAYFAHMDYNEPSNPYVVLNYYYENGSYIRMIFGIDRDVSSSLDLNYQGNMVQVLDKKGKLDGYGVGFKSKSRVFVFVPV